MKTLYGGPGIGHILPILVGSETFIGAVISLNVYDGKTYGTRVVIKLFSKSSLTSELAHWTTLDITQNKMRPILMNILSSEFSDAFNKIYEELT